MSLSDPSVLNLLENDDPAAGYYGVHYAKVIDTNDPLCVGRLRVLCPLLLDQDVEAQMVPWAVPAPFLGSPRVGDWGAPLKGDIVALAFQNGDPHSPMWLGTVRPTMTRLYPLLAQHQPAQPALDANGDPDPARPLTDDADYFPQDGRPMSRGIGDPYGNLLWLSGVGYFPDAHKERPAPVGSDPLLKVDFKSLDKPPVANDPDVKLAALLTPYGNYLVLSDGGYSWKKDGDFGEFVGDFRQDEKYQVARAKALRRQLTQGQSKGRDQRRNELGTRYRHQIILSDVGWAQPGPKSSKSRRGEYGDPCFLSRETARDERWIKVRTPGGWLVQLSDVGLDPAEAVNIKRTYQEDIEADPDFDRVWGGKEDARFYRVVSPAGQKFVIDDTGSDPRDPLGQENPRPRGMMLKGRRTGASRANKDRTGSPTGFFLELRDDDDANRLSLGTPLGSLLELSDDREYAVLTVGGAYGQSKPWQGFRDNEFTDQSFVDLSPDLQGPLIFLDNENQFVALRSRSGRGRGPDDPAVNQEDVGDFRAGMEVRDGQKGDGAWVEMNDSDNRGLWMSKKDGLTVIRSREPQGGRGQLLIVLDDKNGRLSIYNFDQDGKTQIQTAGDLEVQCDKSVRMLVNEDLDITANRSIRLSGGGTILEVNGQGIQTPGVMMAKEIRADLKDPQPGGTSPVLPQIVEPPAKVAPEDRGKRYNA
jgi:hypothetical protein